MNEAEVVRRMMKRLNAIPGVYCLRTHGGTFQAKGTPDIFGCALGLFFTIEAKKTAREKPSASQLYMLKQFRQAGGATFVSHDPTAQEVVDWLWSIDIWKPVVGYEGYYEVSSQGQVRSLARLNSRGQQLQTKTLKQRTNEKGYKYVNLFKGGTGSGQRVHRLVARAFHGEPLEGQVVRHLDNNSSHNFALNLKWGTQSENERDKRR